MAIASKLALIIVGGVLKIVGAYIACNTDASIFVSSGILATAAIVQLAGSAIRI